MAPDPTRIFLGYLERGCSFQPHAHVQALAPDDYDGLEDLLVRLKGRAIVVTPMPEDLVRAAIEMDRRGAWPVRGFALAHPAIDPGRIQGEMPLPMVHDPDRVFSMDLVDIRNRSAILETHTLVNARAISYADLMLLRDTEIRALFPPGSFPVFTGYDESLYPRLHTRLRPVLGDGFAFYEGGLERHFLEDRLTIVPEHFNRREIEPGPLMDLYALSGRVRFLCTTHDSCPPGIPQADRITLSLREMGRAAWIETIRALPREGLYVPVVADQESYGNALLAGWLLITSGHDHPGMLIMPTRFSLEEIRQVIKDRLPPEAWSLASWRAHHGPYLDALDRLRRAVETHGWAWVFLVLGLGIRTGLLPAQLAVARSYYAPRPRPLLQILAAGIVLGTLIQAWRLLDRAIRDFALVPHGVVNAVPDSVSSGLLSAFLALVGIQLTLSFPRRPRLALAILAGLLALRGLGMMDNVSPPLLLFLLGGEVVALLLQLPFFIAWLKRHRLRQDGIALRPEAGDRPADWPAKWRDLMLIDPQPGFLVEIARVDPRSQAFRRTLASLGSGPWIVRSAARDRRETRLGGFHASCRAETQGEVCSALDRLARDGCDFAWIQPFLAAARTGILASLSREGRRGLCLCGPPEAATEGRQASEEIFLDTKDGRRRARAERRLLRRIERRAGRPVLLEYGLKGQRAIPFQIRFPDPESAPETKLWPQGRMG